MLFNIPHQLSQPSPLLPSENGLHSHSHWLADVIRLNIKPESWRDSSVG
jgi:hypothetical protein